MLYADVIVPLPLFTPFTYSVPLKMQVEVGMIVLVPFGNGKGREVTAVVVKIYNKPSIDNKYKVISEILPNRLLPSQVELLKFVSHYYYSPIGEVYNQLLPAQLLSRNGVPDSYKPLVCKEYVLNPKYDNKLAQDELRKQMQRAPSRLDAFEKVLAGMPIIQLPYIRRKDLLKHDIIVRKDVVVSRIDTTSQPSAEPYSLTEHQTQVFVRLLQLLQNHSTALLHGVTSSGKTEIYIKLIQQTIEKGKQVLMIVPETSLTQHLYNRLKQYFGNALGVYHTQCPQEERMEVYVHQLTDSPYQVILGTRQALFLPFADLGLVIVDEEHDVNYKQIDHIPYYNARDVALYLAKIHNAKSILGTATPSVETFSKAKIGQYAYVRMTERYGNAQKPQIHIVDMKEERRKKHLNGHFSRLMTTQINAALADHHQVILFGTGRGFSPYVQCSKCGEVSKCPQCDVALTYSKRTNTLSCPYCGHTQPYNIVCDKCGNATLEPRGLGVEQLEEETKMLFPEARVVRFNAKEAPRILHDFENGMIDIMIGNRTTVKGIDYKNVEVFGIMNIDNLLNHPDFRANERAYQLIVQAAGRTGRHSVQGHLVLQTYNMDNPFIEIVQRGCDDDFYEQQLAERKLFKYPPYTRIIKVEVRHYWQNVCLSAVNYIMRYLEVVPNIEVVGPVEPQVSFIEKRHVRQLLVKMTQNAQLQEVKGNIRNSIFTLQNTKGYSDCIFKTDIDPI